MKAVYINLDPYLAAFAAWIKGGKVGDAPTFDPLPLAVTVPLGESAAIYLEKAWVAEDEDFGPDFLTIDGTTIGVAASITGEGDALARDAVPGISALAPSAKYAVVPVAGDASVLVYINDGESDVGEIRFTVLVRRETASGPVDLVDFTPPASAPSAADIKSALVAAGEGALAGVKLDGAILVTMEDGMQPDEATQIGEAGPLVRGADLETQLGVGSASA